jgi:hypothetical protein
VDEPKLAKSDRRVFSARIHPEVIERMKVIAAERRVPSADVIESLILAEWRRRNRKADPIGRVAATA